MKRLTVVLFAVACLYAFSAGVVYAAQWTKVYGGTGTESGIVYPIDTGGFYLSGSTTPKGGNTDALFAKLTASGLVSWAKTIGGSAEDHLAVVKVDNGYLVTGNTKSFPSPGDDYNLVWAKFNASWAPVYQKVFGGGGDEGGIFYPNSQGGLLFCGTTGSLGAEGDDDILIMKINSLGNIVWTKAFHKGTTDQAGSIIELDNGYIVSGMITDTSVNPMAGILLMKLSKSTGAPLWTKLLNLPVGTGILSESGLHPLADGNFILEATVTSLASMSQRAILVKVSPAGRILWQRSYGSASASVTLSTLTENPDGSFLASGTLLNSTTQKSCILAMKLNANGTLSSPRKRLGPWTQYNSGYVLGTKTGELFLSGFHRTTIMDLHPKILYAKLDPATFAPLWAKTFGGTGIDTGAFFAESGTYMLSGNTTSFGPGTPAQPNIFAMILDADGDYPGCHVNPFSLPVADVGITVANPLLTATIPLLTASNMGGAADITLTVTPITLPASNICPPITSEALSSSMEESETLDE
jgi:hypothetical protein